MPDILQYYSWSELWYPGVLLFILSVQAGYLFLIGPLRRKHSLGPPVPTARMISFLVGVFLVYVAEGTPIHVISENYLFSVHMVQHTILTSFFPPLVLLGMPDWMLRPLLRPRWLKAFLTFLTRPVTALALFNLIYSIWHLPVLYSTALYKHEIHMVQHALLVPTALLLWWPILSPLPELPRLSDLGQMFYVFLWSVAQMAVFGLITFAEEAHYAPYVAAPRLWGIDPIVDQQIAGVIMNVIGGLIGLVVLGIIFFRWAARSEREGQAENMS